MPQVFLLNPSVTSFGYGLITPRWLFVLAQATPSDLVGDPIIIDESIKKIDVKKVNPGDIIGISLTTSNCAVGYRTIKELKRRGAWIIAGGIHATIFPDEPLRFGADSVVTGNGDLVWPEVVKDALNNNLKKKYVGGKVSGNQLLSARWKSMNPANYMAASVQTIAGCPENCSFCSVWVTDGRKPRQRLTEKIIAEVNELYSLGFRFLVFADDNFNPSTLGRIAREKDPRKRQELEKTREERLKFFDEYACSVPKDIYGFTQMTSEIVSDPEYLEAMYDKMRIRGALVGVESFSEDGLISANKQWNPAGEKMIKSIKHIQSRGVTVLTSIICGLESDTKETIQSMGEFAIKSGSHLAQFIIYSPYPGTVDYLEMTGKKKSTRKTFLLYDDFWLDPEKPPVLIKHPNLDKKVLIEAVKKNWNNFYSLKRILERANNHTWNLKEKIWYLVFSIAFKNFYIKDGLSADSARSQRINFVSASLLRVGVHIYNYLAKNRRGLSR